MLIGYRGIIVSLLFVLLFAVGCGSAQEVQLGAADDGKRIELTKGQVLVVKLESNPTTGYSWQVVDLEGGVLQQVGEAEFVSDSDLVGSGGVETLRFEAKEAGQVTLKLVYHRPWEDDVAPVETFSVTVVVK